MMDDIHDIWLKQESTSGKNVLRQKLSAITGLNCYIGLVQITGARMFQMELGDSPPLDANYLKKFRGVEIQIVTYADNQSVYTIILLERELTDIFTIFGRKPNCRIKKYTIFKNAFVCWTIFIG
jgi:hypothetical protein